MSDLARAAWREPYFTDGDECIWHVYDCVRWHGLRQVILGETRAEWRVFVSPTGTKLRYQLKPAEPREPTADRLERQRRVAKSSGVWEGGVRPTRRARR